MDSNINFRSTFFRVCSEYKSVRKKVNARTLRTTGKFTKTQAVFDAYITYDSFKAKVTGKLDVVFVEDDVEVITVDENTEVTCVDSQSCTSDNVEIGADS